MRKIACLVILSAFILTAGCISSDESPQPQEETKVVEAGDVVTIHFIAWEKETGAVFETSIADVNATKEIELDGSHEHSAMKVTVKAANPAPGTVQTLPGLEEALMGMKVGEKKTVEIPPAKAYGKADEEQIKKLKKELKIPRKYTENIVTEIDYKVFQQMVEKKDVKAGETVMFADWWEVEILDITQDSVKIQHHPTADKVITTSYGPYKVTEITEEQIHLEFALGEGEKYQSPRFKAVVKEIKEDHIVVELDYKLGETVPNTLPECSTCFTFGKVTEVTDEYITVDFNMPLKGKTVVFNVKVVDIEKVGG